MRPLAVAVLSVGGAAYLHRTHPATVPARPERGVSDVNEENTKVGDIVYHNGKAVKIR